MTQAYLEGFKKVAEEYGIDPELLKKAQEAFGRLGPTLEAADYDELDSIDTHSPGLPSAFGIALAKYLPSIGLKQFLSNPGHLDARLSTYDTAADRAIKEVREARKSIKPGITSLQALLAKLGKKNLALGTGGAVAGGLAGYAGYKLLSKNKKKEKPEKKASYDAVLKLAQQGLDVAGPRVDTAKLDSMAQLMRSPQTDIQFEKALPSEGMLRYLSGSGHKDAFNAAFAKAWAAAKNRSTNPKVPGPGTAPKPPLHIAQPPKVPAVKLPQPK